MNKIIALLLSLTSIWTLVGCGEKTDVISDTVDSPTTENIETAQNADKSTNNTLETFDTTTADNIEVTEVVEEFTVENSILAFVDAFNSDSNVSLLFNEDFTPSDESSSHYRTEFRLGAYSDAIGKSYMYSETVVDLVGKQSWSGDISIRVYMDEASLDQCVEMLKYASPIMDPDIDSAELEEAIDYVTENKTANGYYYADLGLLILGNDSDGYEFMLKMGND